MTVDTSPLLKSPHTSVIEQAALILRQGGTVALPTETVYGLGVDAGNLQAIKRLYQIKGRPISHPVIVHLGEIGQLKTWASDISPVAWQLAEAFWPGPLTLILKRSSLVPNEITGGQDTVGIRIPNHPAALAILEAFGSGIVAPSANRFGSLSPTTAQDVQQELGTEIDLVVDGGACPVGVESTIIDVSTDHSQILRPGMITPEIIHDMLGISIPIAPLSSVKAPGTLISHYAPHTPLTIVPTELLLDQVSKLKAHGKQISVLAYSAELQALSSDKTIAWHWIAGVPEAFSSALYKTLRQCDQDQADVILVEAIPQEGLWAAAFDRLKRASAC